MKTPLAQLRQFAKKMPRGEPRFHDAADFRELTATLQLIAGVLFLFRRTVPLALTIAGPLIVNILLFHALMDPGGIGPGHVVTALWFVVYWQFRAAFFGIFFTEAQSDRSR